MIRFVCLLANLKYWFFYENVLETFFDRIEPENFISLITIFQYLTILSQIECYIGCYIIGNVANTSIEFLYSLSPRKRQPVILLSLIVKKFTINTFLFKMLQWESFSSVSKVSSLNTVSYLFICDTD